jgi:hypothetical protein
MSYPKGNGHDVYIRLINTGDRNQPIIGVLAAVTLHSGSSVPLWRLQRDCSLFTVGH